MAEKAAKCRQWPVRGILAILLAALLVCTGGVAEAGTWIKATTNVTSDLMSVAYGNGLWVVVGKAATGTDQILYSTDGLNWTDTHPTGALNNWYGVANAGNNWVIVGNAGHVAYTTDPTGTSDSWHMVSPVSGNLWSAASDATKVIAVGSGGTAIAASTADLSSWSPITGVPSTVTLYDIVYQGGTWVAVGKDSSAPYGHVYKYDEASNAWQQVATNASSLVVAAYGNSQFLVAGDGGAIMTSSDGNTWSSMTHGTSLYQGAAYGLGKWVLCTFDGTIQTYDGTTWSTETGPQPTPPAATHYLRVVHAAQRFVMAGYAGVIGVQLEDTTPPTTTDNAPNGWTNQDTTVTLTATDDISGVNATYYKLDNGSQTAGTSVSVTGEGDHTLQYWSVDNAGNVEATHTVHVRIDRTTPSIAHTLTPAANADGWNQADVTVTFTCTDADAGIATCTTPVTVSTEGQGQTVSGTATDNAGNSTTDTTAVNLDKTPPTVTANVPAGPVNADQSITLTAVDPVSGVQAVYYKVDGATAQTGTTLAVAGDGTHTLEYWAVDKAGNASAHTTQSIVIDKVQPTITHTVLPAPNSNGWNKAPVTVTFACADAGTGVASCTPAQTVSTEGANRQVTGTATDAAGNTATDTATVNLDLTPPTLSGAATTAPNANGWYNGNVTIHWTASDALSGINPATVPPDTVITGSGSNLSATATVFDYAGNSTTVTVSGINIKRTLPGLSLAHPGDHLLTNNTRPTYSGTADVDATVRLYVDSTLVATLVPGSNRVWSFTPPTAMASGTHVWFATATDIAGNVTTSATRRFTVDTTPPYVTLTSPGSVVTSATPTLSGVAEAGSLVTVAVDGRTIGSVISAGTFGIAPSTPLADGPHSAVAWAVDGAGNTATSATVQFVVQARLPTVTITSPSAGQVLSKRPDIAGTADANATVTVSIGGTALGSVTVGASGTWRISGTGAQLQVGPNQVTAQVRDAMGRAGAPASVTFMYSPKGSLTGTVIDANGRPASGVPVQVADAGGAPVATVTTDQTGGFKLDQVPTGTLTVTAGTGPASVTAQVQVQPDKTATVSLQLRLVGVRHLAYVTGYPDGTFQPDRAVTRAEAAAMLARLLADGSVHPAAAFADVSANHWATQAIGFVQAKGLMIGDPDGRFRPNDRITRAELAVIVSRIKNLSPDPINMFTDTAGHWAAGYIEAARQAGLVTGFPDGTFHPQEAATRAQFVAMMARTFGRGRYLGRTVPTFVDVPASHWAAGYVEEAVTDHTMTKLSDGIETW